MGLPKSALPTYELKLPSSGKKLAYRPYLVREEKLLLIAAESGDPKEIVNATRQVVQNVVLDPLFDVDKQPVVDIDYIFVCSRSKSVSDNVEVTLTCKERVLTQEAPYETVDCGGKTDFSIKAEDIKVVRPDASKSTKIAFDKTSGVIMRLAPFESLRDIDEVEAAIEKELFVIRASIDSVYDKDQVYKVADFTQEEVEEWVDGLTKEQFGKIKAWIEGVPYLELEIKTKCSKCGKPYLEKKRNVLSFF